MEGNVESNQDVSILKGKVSKIPQVDITLSKEGYAADAKATGDALAELKRQIDELASE